MSFAPKKILVGTDFSEPAVVAADAAADLALQSGGSLILLYVVPLSTYVDFAEGLGQSSSWDANVQATVTANAKAKLAREAERLSKRGIKVTALTADGPPQIEIADVAARESADLVVVGSHGRTGLKRVLIGSVAEGVVRHCRCAVLVVHAPER
jgi:nucleotide-binding universal stress UspA family protein